jgi:hypothetical protein
MNLKIVNNEYEVSIADDPVRKEQQRAEEFIRYQTNR